MMNSNIFELNSTYTCPCCGGVLRQAKSPLLILRCHDCGSLYHATDIGVSDNTNTYIQVHIGQSSSKAGIC